MNLTYYITMKPYYYAQLMRLDKPIGILLLLWPTLWGLWLASNGRPSWHLLFVFIAGVILTRSAGCVLNDMADRHVDGHVERTRSRPLASGAVSYFEASVLAFALVVSAFLLVMTCNPYTILLSILGASFMVIYPLLKRITHVPQIGLGIAFSWGIPMSFAAVQNHIPPTAWFLFATGLIWPIIYDTMYAMVDRKDDMNVGIKSTAILFAAYDRVIIGILQFVFIFMLIGVGYLFELPLIYYMSLLIVSGLFVYQQYLITDRLPTHCFHAFLNHHWVGMVIFLGIWAAR